MCSTKSEFDSPARKNTGLRIPEPHIRPVHSAMFLVDSRSGRSAQPIAGVYFLRKTRSLTKKSMSKPSVSQHSVSSGARRLHFAPIAAAVAAALVGTYGTCACAAHTPFDFPDENNIKWDESITLNLDRISNKEGFDWLTDKGALITVDGCDEDCARTPVQWWSKDYTNDLYQTSEDTTRIPGDEHAKFTVKNSSGAFNLGWDFSLDKSDSTYSPAIANFRPAILDNESADRFLKHFTFESANDGPISIVTKNSKITSTNAGNSQAMLGISLSNKRGWMTFAEETYLVSDFQFDYDGSEAPDSGTTGEFIAAGVYATFGANTNVADDQGGKLYDSIFEIDNNTGTYSHKIKDGLDLDKYGYIEFQKRSVVSVTAVTPEDPGEDHSGQLHEVFGVLVNEGGAVEFQQGGDILVKGRDKHHLVSALASASTLGVLDPLKQGDIRFTAREGVNRIWGWSDNYEGAPITVGDADGDAPLFKDDGHLNDSAFTDMQGQIEDYLEEATGGATTTDQNLRGSILAANGAEITVTDTGDGWLDIRGDVVAGVKNGSGATSNTFVSKGGELNNGQRANTMTGTVTRAAVTLALTNEKSTLVGNVYERHRVGEEEAVQLKTDDGKSAVHQDQSFAAWQAEQYRLERTTLGGTVDLQIANGAVWYPTKDWKGWNNDILYRNADQTSASDYLDFSDQYNLHVWQKGGGYAVENNTLAGNTDPVAEDKINDLDLLDGNSDPGSILTSQKKGDDYRTVDNGVYHLKLDGGTVDLSYLRRDFQMSTDQEALGTIGQGEKFTKDGIKKFRVQALNGSSGTFRIYAKDAENHDLVIVDEMRDASNRKIENAAFDLNFVLWNDEIGEKPVIDPENPMSFIQIARVPDSVNVTAESYGEGRTTYTVYRVEKDEKTEGTDGKLGYDEGSYTYDQGLEWHDRNVNWFITGEAENREDMAVIGTTELAANLGYLMATTMETLRDRRGEMTFNGTKEDGWWVRYTHDRFGLEGFTAETDGFQFGYEWMKPEDEGRLFRGAALDVAQGDVDYDRMSGQSEADRYRLSAYQTYIGNNGVYYDAVLRAGWYDAETNVAYTRDNGTVYDMRGDFDYWAAAASFEAGHRFESDNAWWIEPEVQLQYTYIADYDYKTNQGIRIDTDDTQSLIGRFGVRMGKVLTSDAGRHMSVWAGADVFHEWLGDRDGTMTGIDETVRYDIEGDDTWWDAVFGMTWETGPDSRLWAAAKHDFGGDKENTWTVNVGATWNF